MITTDNPNEFFAFQAATNQVIGYHSSVQSASSGIEKFGFLPNKILTPEDHTKLIELANAYQLKSIDLRVWLSMCSVTFTKSPDDAINHVKQGKAGGQGIKNILAIIEILPPEITEGERIFIDTVERKIRGIRGDQPITYIVDLSDLGPQLDSDKIQSFYYYRWDPKKPLPEISEIGPERILLKLVHKWDHAEFEAKKSSLKTRG